MSGIFNVGNTYNTNNKRIASKLSFDTGEKFSGKIVKKEGDKGVTIHLIDGLEFEAEINRDLDSLPNGLTRFQVEGFENGKLKLKIIGKKLKEEEVTQSDINEIILKEGLKKEDFSLLKDMIKFNIPLTKDNIREIKGLIQFLNKIKENPNEIKEFISKYLLSKGIDENTLKGNNVSNALENFFNEFETLSKEDLLLFVENDIEFNEDNIKAFKTMFKSENGVDKLIKDISDAIPQLTKETQEVRENVVDNIKNNINIKDMEGSLNKIINEDINIDNRSIDNKIGSEAYQKNEGNTKVSLLSILKSISGQTEDYINGSLKDILLNRKSEFTTSQFDKTFNFINKLNPEEFIKNLKDINSQFKEVENFKIENDSKEILNKTRDELIINNQSLNFTKEEVEVLLSKLIEKGIKLTEEEFSRLKDGINLKNQELFNEEKPLKELINPEIKNIVDEKTSNNIKELSDSKRNINDLLTKDIIKTSINKNGEVSKQVIKDLLEIIKNEGDKSDKIVSALKNSINDIKIFNKISSEYYYADIPINIKEREYPCKIIVKDKRQDGKKIDSTNIKMVITVDTNNLGTIDGYMKVLDKKIDIDLKCAESYVKIIDMAKGKLISSIEGIGFTVEVRVSKKKEEVSITTCRDFFNSGFGISIDRRV